jgi:DNA-binding XRE family transcriptional regulator
MNNFYIYIYLDPRKYKKYIYGEYKFDYEPFYVGKGKNGRYKVKYGRTLIFKNKINKIKKLKLEPVIIKLFENLSEEESLNKEIELIDKIGRIDLGTGPLINKTIGGDGVSGYKFSEEKIERIAIKRRKDFSDIKKEFKKRNYKLLTEEKDYKNCYTKLYYICQRGHKGDISWSNFQQKRNCYNCKKEKQRKDFYEIKKEFKKRNYKLLTEEDEYKNSKQKLKYICPEGHEGSISWDSFRRNNNCPICYNYLRSEKNKGINNPQHKLTEEQVIQIKLLLKEGKLTQQEIADIFGVSQMTISLIKSGKKWSHIEV